MGHPGFIGGQKNVSRAVVDLRYAKLPRVVRDFLTHDRRGVHHVECFEQELEALLELLSDLFAKRVRQRPEALFQRGAKERVSRASRATLREAPARRAGFSHARPTR